jgi:hypothetical protein
MSGRSLYRTRLLLVLLLALPSAAAADGPRVSMIEDIRLGTASSDPGYNQFTPFYASRLVNGVMFFAANNGIHGVELWKTDGLPRARCS